ncbi:TrmH family RNA methyltransferase [Flavobacterium sp. NST-5]|uniref:tRNA (guanosine(18)-2'-O)-methyltransferase n=1 Tax=Flavobacterium ichthyis TaxID=2698827 RepID=A0ABW9Z599_9FLAO|nr:RNA methyltransferase [Flavobacterium ichthyis]NBL64015.1 TrmH family RNA methyltransferase [Flavobacterium ichthyis]
MKDFTDKLHYFNYLQDFITDSRKEKFLKVLQNRTNHFSVAIEDVYQLHNTSAVMRSCEVFGVQNLHVVEEKFGKKIDTEIAMGAQKWVNIHRYNSNADCIAKIKAEGYQIIATTPHNDSCFLDDFDITKRSAIFFGTERHGLSGEVMDAADGFLKIPMAGFTESLNISVSAAIVLQNLTSRLRKSNVEWKLTEEEIFNLRLQWTKASIKNFESVNQRYLETFG